MRVHFQGDLEDIAREASLAIYPENPTQPSVGWGSLVDDEHVVGGSSALPLKAHVAVIQAATETMPKRLRLRYYFDHADRRLTRSYGDSASWDRIHIRNAIDFVIFDGETEAGFPVLATIRNQRDFDKFAVEAMKNLGGGVAVESDVIPETLSPNHYQWLLYRLHLGGRLADGIQLEAINEMSASQQVMSRGSKFSNDAPLERADLAALLAIGNASFGPAKLSVSSEELDGHFEFEWNHDGGFSVYRGSSYGTTSFPVERLGVTLIEDLWCHVLPKIRTEYASDSEWSKGGEEKLKKLALGNLAALLGLDIGLAA